MARLGQVPLPAWRTAEQVASAERNALVAAWSANDPARAVFVAETGAAFAGFIYVNEEHDYFSGARCGHVDMLVVAEGAEGTGTGTALMSAGEAWAKERGLPLLTLNVFIANQRARSLYERLGFGPETVKYVKVL